MPTRLKVLLMVLLVAPSADASDYQIDWKTIETAHFIIHYDKPDDKLARHVAIVSETAHQRLAPKYDYKPREKTIVVLLNQNDGSNGSATVIPRNVVRLFATAPRPSSVLADHDDWLTALMFHEYLHIVHLDTIGPLPTVINSILGKTWAPNQIQPGWVIEGLATYEESELTSGGRVRSSNFNAELRMATLREKVHDLDRTSNIPFAWPVGNITYMYGSHFLKYLFDKYGHDKARVLAKTYGAEPVPWTLNKTATEVFGRSFSILYKHWESFLESKYALDEEAILRAGVREGKRLTLEGRISSNPKYTPDGKHLLFVDAPGDEVTYIKRMSTTGKRQTRKHVRIRRQGDFDVLPDNSVIAERTIAHRTFRDYQELVIATPGKRTKQITHGKRVIDPAASPDGKLVAFAKNDGRKASLAMMPLNDEHAIEILWQAKMREQASNPTWSPDGKHVAFTRWQDGGYRDIVTVNIDTKKLIAITEDRAEDRHPVYGPKGQYLYFVSDRRGKYDIYAYHLKTHQTFQVSNVKGGVSNPSVSPDGKKLAYQSFIGNGYAIYELDLVPEDWTLAAPDIDARRPPTKLVDIVKISDERDYRPLESLAPQAYTLSFNTGQRTSLTASTDGRDAVGNHAYSLTGTVGDDGRFSGVASYTYGRFWPTLRISVFRSDLERGGFSVGDERVTVPEDRYGFDGSIDLPVLRDLLGSTNASLSIGGDWFRLGEEWPPITAPTEPLPIGPASNFRLLEYGFRIGYGYGDGAYNVIGQAERTGFSVGVRFGRPELGSDFTTFSLDYNADKSFNFPSPGTSTIYMRTFGGVRRNDRNFVPVTAFGGVPSQDIVDSIINTIRFGSNGYLRGYERNAVRGSFYQLANLEYRFLLWRIERGYETVPFYIRDLNGALLIDGGFATTDKLDKEDFRFSVGAALRLDMKFGFFAPGSIDVGVSRGLIYGGITEGWLLMTFPI